MSLCQPIQDFYSKKIGNSMFLPINPKIYNNLCLFNDTNYKTGITIRKREISLLQYICSNHREIPHSAQLFDHLINLDENLMPQNHNWLLSVLYTRNPEFGMSLLGSKHFNKKMLDIPQSNHVYDYFESLLYAMGNVDVFILLIKSGLDINPSNFKLDDLSHSWHMARSISMSNIQELIVILTNKGFVEVPEIILEIVCKDEKQLDVVNYILDNYQIDFKKTPINHVLTDIVTINNPEVVNIVSKFIARGINVNYCDGQHGYYRTIIHRLFSDLTPNKSYSRRRCYRRRKIKKQQTSKQEKQTETNINQRATIFKLLLGAGLDINIVAKTIEDKLDYNDDNTNVALLKQMMFILHTTLTSDVAVKFFTIMLQSTVQYSSMKSISELCINYGANVGKVCSYYKRRLSNKNSAYKDSKLKTLTAFINANSDKVFVPKEKTPKKPKTSDGSNIVNVPVVKKVLIRRQVVTPNSK